MKKLTLTLVLLAGCGGAAPPPAQVMPAATLPNLSVIGDTDSATAPAATCTAGFQVTTMPRKGRAGASAVDGASVWHFAYAVEYAIPGSTSSIYALRTLSSDSATTVQTVGWLRGDTSFNLVTDSKGVATLFYSLLSADSDAKAIVQRARWSSGAWKTDATPVWSGAGSAQSIYAAIGPDGLAHVVFSLATGTQLATENSAGGWTVRNVNSSAGLDSYAAPDTLDSFGVDGRGADHVLLDDGDKGLYYVDDVGGTWNKLVVTEGDSPSFDAAGNTHIVSYLNSGGFSDHHQTASGWSDDSLAMTSPAGFNVARNVSFDAQGNLALLIDSQTGSAFATNVSGSWVITPLPQYTEGFFLDGKAQPHFFTTTVDATNPGLGQPTFIEPCP